MKCEMCEEQTDALIGGFAAQGGQAWCLACCDLDGLKVPLVLRQPYVGDNTSIIREQWFAAKKEKERERFAAFLAKKKEAA